MSNIYGKCSTPGCPHTEYIRGLCATHYGSAIYQKNKAEIAVQRKRKRNAARRRMTVEGVGV